MRAALALMLGAPLFLGACAVVGPASIANGRAAYTDVITRTNDEQLLSMLVRMRYAETSSLLLVSSITAQSEMSIGAGGQVGVGPSSTYSGNLVPFSIDGRYRETPTISYTPVGGEKYLKELLTPIELDLYALLVRTIPTMEWIMPLLTEGLADMNAPIFYQSQSADELARSLHLITHLSQINVLNMHFRLGADGNVTGVDLTIEGYQDTARAETIELMKLIDKPMPAQAGAPIKLGLQLARGELGAELLRVQTRCTLELLQLASLGTELPEDHLHAGIAQAPPQGSARPFMRIQSSRTEPVDPMVAVQYRGYWFYVASDDISSKRGFQVVQMLLMRCLDDRNTPKPLLSLPIG